MSGLLPQRIVPFQIRLPQPVAVVRASLSELSSRTSGLRRGVQVQLDDVGGMVRLTRDAGRGMTVTMRGTLRADGAGASVFEGDAAVGKLSWYLPLLFAVLGPLAVILRSGALPSLATLVPGLAIVFGLLYTVSMRARTMMIQDVERALRR